MPRRQMRIWFDLVGVFAFGRRAVIICLVALSSVVAPVLAAPSSPDQESVAQADDSSAMKEPSSEAQSNQGPLEEGTEDGLINQHDAGETEPLPAGDTAEMSQPQDTERLVGQESEVPWELRPYNVRIDLAFGQTSIFTERFRQSLRDDIRKSADRTYGETWNLNIGEIDWLIPPSRESLDRLVDKSIKERIAEQDAVDADKAFLITVEAQGSAYQVSGREWDRFTETLGPLVTRTVYIRNTLGITVARVVQQLFRPVLEIRSTDALSATVRIRAGELLPLDSPDALLTSGALFQPFFRYLDREHRVRAIQLVPWTYLRVEQIERSLAHGTLISGLRSPIGSGPRRRVEIMAIAVHPHAEETQLRLVNQRDRTRPLVGYQVLVFNNLPQRPSSDQEATDAEDPEKPLSVLSDRNGSVTVSIDAEHPLRWIYVRSGEAVLARVPIVPGTQPRMTIAVPDDSLQMEVEGRLARLQAELIDVVARRAVLITVLQRFGQAGKWDRVDKVLAELETLPQTKYFQSQLEAIRFPAVKAAQEQRLRVVESKIQKACRDTKELIEHHLDDSKLRDVKAEVAELRKLDASRDDGSTRQPASRPANQSQ